MKLWQNSDELTEVKWFRAKDDAKVLEQWTTFRHAFYSTGQIVTANAGDNDSAARNAGMGMQWPYQEDPDGCIFGYPYQNNQAPAEYDGQRKCGSDDVWLSGGVSGQDPGFETDDNGRAGCCDPPDVQKKTVRGEGGQVEGGEAPSYRGFIFYAEGGQVEGGEAPTTFAYVWTADGGQVEGGEALNPFRYAWTADGGQVEGGEAPNYRAYTWTADGGQVEGGEAPTTFAYAWTADGGQAEGGAAPYRFVWGWTADGGMVEGGEAPNYRAYVWTASGGMVEGGEAPDYRAYVWTADGGMVEGGEATSTQTGYTFVADGGQVEGGEASAAGEDDNMPRNGDLLGYQYIDTSESTTSVPLVDLPTVHQFSVTLTAACDVLIEAGAWLYNSTVQNAIGTLGVLVNGTLQNYPASVSCAGVSARAIMSGAFSMRLPAGTHVIKMQYNTNTGTAYYSHRYLKCTRASLN